MKLTLLSKQELTSIILPEKHAGRYWIYGKNSNGKTIGIVAVEALKVSTAGNTPKWILKSNRRFKVYDKNNEPVSDVDLNDMELYRIQGQEDRLNFILYTEPLSNDRKFFKAYELVRANANISIGRYEDNNIVYFNNFVSGKHAELIFTASNVVVRDLGSMNNTYVNGKAVKQQVLNNGNVVYIMGLQIVIVDHRIFINNPDGNLKLRSNELIEYKRVDKKVDSVDFDDDDFDDNADYYYRAPRFKNNVEVFNLKLDAPPSNQNNDEMPMIMLIGPSVTMGMASIASGLFAVTSAIERGDITSAIPSIVMSVSMLLGTLMWPIITKSYQKKLKIKKELKRQETYKNYILQMEQLITRETARQENTLRNNDVNISVYVKRVTALIQQIWERTPKHNDFLSLRLGDGNLPLKANIQYPERRFTVEEDNLTEIMYLFGEKKRWLNNVPVCLSLIENYTSGIYGNKEVLFSYAKNLILQTITLHSYDEVKLVLLYDAADAEIFSALRWLPHMMNNEHTVRYIASNPEEAKELSFSLDSIIEYRKGLDETRLEDQQPYFIIICLDKELATKTECVRRVQEHKDYIKFSVISLFEKLKDLPKECTAVVELNNSASGVLTLIDEMDKKPILFNIDLIEQDDYMERVVDVLANTEIEISGANYILPKKYTFFQMLDIGMIEHLNLIENWTTNDPTKSLAASIGVDKYGELFKLDLHENAHGPHGLIAGMTGSGKSEFVISYILSMAVNFHPYEVSFILIDYKGGGMAKSFENIPHTAGVITNLDGNRIKRSLASMRSELHRRESIFRDISINHNISNIDIYKYQKLYREGKVAEPLPHLFIISDEFAFVLLYRWHIFYMMLMLYKKLLIAGLNRLFVY